MIHASRKESALCWVWTDGHDTLWTLDLEDDKHCNDVEAYYQKQMDWFCEDDQPCGPLMYNSWQYDLMKYATMICKPHSYLDDQAFDKLFRRAVGQPEAGDQIRIKNESFLTLLDTVEGGIFADSLYPDGIVTIDTLGGIFGVTYGVDVFKCQEINSPSCDISSQEDFLFQLFLQLFLGECFSILSPGLDLFIPAIFPEPVQMDIFDNWKNYRWRME